MSRLIAILAVAAGLAYIGGEALAAGSASLHAGFERAQAAGAEVLEFRQFGCHQCDWWAKVIYNGEFGWVQGSYGSCSGSDAFESEFGYSEQGCDEHRDDHQEACPACKEEKQKCAERLPDFGRIYLDGLLTQQKAEEEAARNLEWDSEAQEMLDWVRAHSLPAN